MSSALSRRESLSRISSTGSTGIRGSIMSWGHHCVPGIDSIDTMGLSKNSLTSTIESFRIRVILLQPHAIDDIDVRHTLRCPLDIMLPVMLMMDILERLSLRLSALDITVLE